MKKDIVIYGASGLGREIYYFITTELQDSFNVIGFIDDGLYNKDVLSVDKLPVYQKDFLYKHKSALGIIIAIADTKIKQRLYEELSSRSNLTFPPLVSRNIKIPDDSAIGDGSIIKGSSTVSVNVKVGRCVLLNGSVSLGHDAIIGDFVSIMPKCSISGNVIIGDNVFIGGHSFILQGKKIGNNSTIAPGSTVFTNVPPNVTVMGNPATILLRHRDKKI